MKRLQAPRARVGRTLPSHALVLVSISTAAEAGPSTPTTRTAVPDQRKRMLPMHPAKKSLTALGMGLIPTRREMSVIALHHKPSASPEPSLIARNPRSPIPPTTTRSSPWPSSVPAQELHPDGRSESPLLA